MRGAKQSFGDDLMFRSYLRWRDERFARQDDAHKRIEPMEAGLDWLGIPRGEGDPVQALRAHMGQQVSQTHLLFRGEPVGPYHFENGLLRFPSPLTTETEENNWVTCRMAESRARQHAVLIVPHWNSSPAQYDRFCGCLKRLGITAACLTLPYHDSRRAAPAPVIHEMVSANLGRTFRSCRQAVLDARAAIDWLVSRGHRTVSLIGVSLGTSIASIVAAHDERVSGLVLLLAASRFGQAVWTGRATQHVRLALEGHITPEHLDEVWSPLSPATHVPHLVARAVPLLTIWAADDQVFLPDLAREFVRSCASHGLRHAEHRLPCGHYTAGLFPYNLWAAVAAIRFLSRNVWSDGKHGSGGDRSTDGAPPVSSGSSRAAA